MASNDQQQDGDWREYRRLVLGELKRVNDNIETLERKIESFRQEDIQKIKVDIAMLQVKSGLWGGASGLLAALGVVLMSVVKNG